ncbi:hypothetical protein CY34DRAFT_728615 [Suillus luteus UH-Slu-Lm8-n1]|uniref:Uncharacterized protein n=1 Tax=Suillus luteus UH-Slu-Lm8-n1 TaxID=930992 RepID=A0A0D0AMU1_9AGAM|nr:hypothetical protein CY34DRAFT_728615 [Suillus luteus UH-Slu-Lm8-n1]
MQAVRAQVLSTKRVELSHAALVFYQNSCIITELNPVMEKSGPVRFSREPWVRSNDTPVPRLDLDSTDDQDSNGLMAQAMGVLFGVERIAVQRCTVIIITAQCCEDKAPRLCGLVPSFYGSRAIISRNHPFTDLSLETHHWYRNANEEIKTGRTKCPNKRANFVYTGSRKACLNQWMNDSMTLCQWALS